MTDEQIIKALKCCGRYHNEGRKDTHCRECQFKSYLPCVAFLCDRTIDLINRQKAEIERLQKIIVGFMDEVGTWSNKYEVDISTIHKLPLLAKEDFNIRNKIKSEAIKEFWERLKLKKAAVDSWVVYVESGDNLVKEMTEPVKIEHNSLCETETYMGELMKE